MKILLQDANAYIVPDDFMGLQVQISVTVISDIQPPATIERCGSLSTNFNMPLPVAAEILMNELLLNLPRKGFLSDAEAR